MECRYNLRDAFTNPTAFILGTISCRNNDILKPINIPYEDIVSRDSPVIVVLCKSEQILRIFESITKEMRQLPVKWLLVPTDYVLNVPTGTKTLTVKLQKFLITSDHTHVVPMILRMTEYFH